MKNALMGFRVTITPRMDVGGLPMCSRENGVLPLGSTSQPSEEHSCGNSCELTTLNTSRVCVCLLILFGWNSLNMYIYLCLHKKRTFELFSFLMTRVFIKKFTF